MAARAIKPQSIKPAPFAKVAWNVTAADYNILENGPGGSVGCSAGQCCSALIVASPAGSLVIVDASGNTVTIPQAILLAQPYLPIAAKSLVAAGSGNAAIMVLWDDE